VKDSLYDKLNETIFLPIALKSKYDAECKLRWIFTCAKNVISFSSAAEEEIAKQFPTERREF
jgi:hypothetical protein